LQIASANALLGAATAAPRRFGMRGGLQLNGWLVRRLEYQWSQRSGDSAGANVLAIETEYGNRRCSVQRTASV
jgi:hypothetical protein